MDNDGANPTARKKWLKWGAIGAFAFFMIKGLAWLALVGLVWFGLIK